MKEVRSYEELVAHRDDLKSSLRAQRVQIEINIREFRKAWGPLFELGQQIIRSVTRFRKHPLLSAGLGLVGETLLASGGVTGRWFLHTAFNKLIGSGTGKSEVLATGMKWLGKFLGRKKKSGK